MASGENEEETSSYAALFQKLNVDMRIRKAIARMGIVHPTLVQAKCLDLAITKGRDLVCRAKTGSGKVRVTFFFTHNPRVMEQRPLPS